MEAGFNNETGCYEIRTLDNYKKYDQVFISYGSHDNYHLLMEYGFTLPDNPNDAVMMDYGKNWSGLRKLPKSHFLILTL